MAHNHHHGARGDENSKGILRKNDAKPGGFRATGNLSPQGKVKL